MKYSATAVAFVAAIAAVNAQTSITRSATPTNSAPLTVPTTPSIPGPNGQLISISQCTMNCISSLQASGNAQNATAAPGFTLANPCATSQVFQVAIQSLSSCGTQNKCNDTTTVINAINAICNASPISGGSGTNGTSTTSGTTTSTNTPGSKPNSGRGRYHGALISSVSAAVVAILVACAM